RRGARQRADVLTRNHRDPFAARRQFRQASSLSFRSGPSVHPDSRVAGRRTRLALAVLIGLPALADAAPTDCAPNDAGCAKAAQWAMCGAGTRLDFHVPGLPTDGDRAAAPREVSAESMHSPDGQRYELSGKAEIRQLDL